MLKRGSYYPLSDFYPIRGGPCGEVSEWTKRDLLAKWDGKPRRAPKKGEWYLSGSIIEAYRAPHDLFAWYHIAVIVRVEKSETYTEVPI